MSILVVMHRGGLCVVGRMAMFLLMITDNVLLCRMETITDRKHSCSVHSVIKIHSFVSNLKRYSLLTETFV